MRPCRCGAMKERRWHLVCPACWATLPLPLRGELYAAYAESQGGERHRVAVRACLEFLREAA